MVSNKLMKFHHNDYLTLKKKIIWVFFLSMNVMVSSLDSFVYMCLMIGIESQVSNVANRQQVNQSKRVDHFRY